MLRETIWLLIVMLISLPAAARETAGQTSSCSADCLLTSCSVTCSSGTGGGAVCTCAYGVATCACGGGGSVSTTIVEAPFGLTSTSHQNVLWRQAPPRSAPADPAQRPELETNEPRARRALPEERESAPPAPSHRVLYAPSEEHLEDRVGVQTLLRAFGTPASRRALAAAQAVQATLLSGDHAAHERETRKYLDAIEALTPPQREALSLFIENTQVCRSRSTPAAGDQ